MGGKPSLAVEGNPDGAGGHKEMHLWAASQGQNSGGRQWVTLCQVHIWPHLSSWRALPSGHRSHENGGHLSALATRMSHAY